MKTKVLDRSSKGLTAIPKPKNAHLITDLYLVDNPIERIDSEDFRPFENLMLLSLYTCQLTEIPARAFIHSPKLRCLRLYQNPIRKIHDQAFEGLTEVWRLDLSECELTEISFASLAPLKALKVIDLSDNKDLERFPGEIIYHLPHLEEINVTGCKGFCNNHYRLIIEDWREKGLRTLEETNEIRRRNREIYNEMKGQDNEI